MAKKIPKIVKQVWESKKKKVPNAVHISYSQLSTYVTCPKKWDLQYRQKLVPYEGSIHTVFGSSLHTVIQAWLEKLYYSSVKEANEMDLEGMLQEEMIKEYKKTRFLNGHKNFSDTKEMEMFFQDGKNIISYLKKKRGGYFTTKGVYLAGIETQLYQELRPGVMFKGFIDLVFYDSRDDTWKIVDIKTSTSGWNKWAKSDYNKIAQILLYKEYFSKQFDIPVDKISIEYFIVKRRVPVDAEFASMQRRVQLFAPASGKINRGKAVSSMNKFVKEAVSEAGEYIEKEYLTNPSKSACRFCKFRDNGMCKDAVMI